GGSHGAGRGYHHLSGKSARLSYLGGDSDELRGGADVNQLLDCPVYQPTPLHADREPHTRELRTRQSPGTAAELPTGADWLYSAAVLWAPRFLTLWHGDW